ncbi:insulinase family protein [Pontibacter sp. KCTC 32443]|uniref:M16 family metallopeptidase n=1 Tax=Pontibacter TaxID=323449 RepID=UPI00164E6DB0|nr:MULTISPECIES: pitrilysin family protein [Pontibacter]MBC5775673.1 insulinase family protein [Pontibacter sp. KCTC 32443]
MLDRTKAPEIKEIDAVSLQVAEVTHLSNGVRLHIIKSETQPVIRLDFVFKAGKVYEQKIGVSDLSAKMLFEGTTNYTAQQIAEKIAFYGASFDNNHGYDRTEYTLYCLSKYVPELLPVVMDVLQNPVFPAEEFSTLKKRNQQNLKIQRQKNNYLATHTFTKLIYGEKHPYIFGYDEGALDAISLEDVNSFYQNNFSLNGLEIFACGAVTEEMEELLISELSKLKAPSDSKRESDIATAVTKGFHTAIDEMPESLQSSIRTGKSFPHITHPDFHRLKVLNEILGGYFGSRLMRNIREDKGYTYGVYSTISPKEYDSLFYIGTDVNFEVTDNTIAEINKEIKLLQDELVSEEELNTVQSYMIGKFLNNIATIFEQADKYKRIILYKLPMEYYSNYITTVRTVTPEEVQQLAQQYLQLEEFKTAIAGKKA